jgi:hypothetical protein
MTFSHIGHRSEQTLIAQVIGSVGYWEEEF